MYIYQPKRLTKAHIVMPIMLLLISAASISASGMGRFIPPFIMQTVAVLAVAVAIQIISRYSLTTFTYEANCETKVLSVRRVTGKKIQLVAAVDYSDIIAVDKREKGYSLKEKYKKAYRIHNFCNNIFPADAYCVVCDIEGNDIALIIEADKKMLELLNNRNSTEE